MPLVRDLVFDVGMHRGEDTAFYLRKGYRVVGFEANPRLARECRQRFAREIGDGRVTVVEGAIVPPGQNSVEFFVNRWLTIWGTVAPAWAERNPGGFDTIEVPAIDFVAHLRDAMPWYLKVDIEGADQVCLEALAGCDARPAFVSIESEKVDFAALRSEIALLSRLGYDRFAAVQQDLMKTKKIQAVDLHGHPFSYQFEDASSGPFGEDLDERWMDAAAIVRRYRWIFGSYRLFDRVNRHKVSFEIRREMQRALRFPLPGWYDTHAGMSG